MTNARSLILTSQKEANMNTTTKKYINKTYSITEEVEKLIWEIGEHYGIGASAALRLVILQEGRKLGLFPA